MTGPVKSVPVKSVPVKTVLFDFGGVFTDSPFHAVRAHADKLGTTDALLNDIVFGGYGNDADHPWHRVERGEISLDAAREGVLELGRDHGLEVDIWDIFLAMAENRGGLRQELVDYVGELRASGLGTGIITNNIVEFRDGWRGMLPVDDLFDFVIDSCEIGVRKPSPKIFTAALDAGGLQPGEAIFVDDYPANVEGAEAMGIESVLVDGDARKTIADIAALLASRPT